jgi:hypothetical protein
MGALTSIRARPIAPPNSRFFSQNHTRIKTNLGRVGFPDTPIGASLSPRGTFVPDSLRQ